jgi:hypothetical protein
VYDLENLDHPGLEDVDKNLLGDLSRFTISHCRHIDHQIRFDDRGNRPAEIFFQPFSLLQRRAQAD